MSSHGPIFEILAPHLKGKIKKTKEGNVLTNCPFHDDTKPSFWLNLDTGQWICFSCGLRGGLYSFLKQAGCSRQLIDEALEPVRENIAAFRLREKFKRDAEFRTDPFKASFVLPEALLGAYDFKPNGLVKQGFDPGLLRSLDIGYDSNLDRITFPLRDLYGNLAGISGRATIAGDYPRYLIYRGRHQAQDGSYITGDFGPNFDDEYPNYSCDAHRFLWNSVNVVPYIMNEPTGKEPILVTEGFKACIWLIQQGFQNSVALIGASISASQRALLLRISGNPIILFLDNDEAGINATMREGRTLLRLVNNRVLIAKYPDREGADAPDDLDQEEVHNAVHNAQEFREWANTIRSRRH